MSVAQRRLPADEYEDAVQDSILSAWEHLHQLKDETAFEAWLTQILINECRQRMRHQKREKAAEQELSHLLESSESLPLHDALDQMNPQERRLLLMHHEEGYSIGEIAKQNNTTEAAVKMRLYRARKSLRALLFSLLLLLLLAAVAVGTGLLDIEWFLENRRSSPGTAAYTDFGSANSISYRGLYLTPEISDVKWDLERLELLITYALAGTDEQTLTVHNGNIGVDGERFDHIWIDGEIIPIADWARGKDVYTYSLDGWFIDGMRLRGSEDALPDGNGEAFMAQLRLDHLDPQTYTMLLSKDGTIMLTCRVIIRNHTTGENIEEELLTICVSAPDIEDWRTAYETFYR